MINENAFWREVMDHLPQLMLVFRIDEFDQAHLIFVNPQVNKWLGYTPKEFLIASESDEGLKGILNGLIEDIAKRSHEIERLDNRDVCFFDRSGRERHFGYEFSLFQTRQSKTNMLAVALSPHVAANSMKADVSSGSQLTPVKAVEVQEPMFVAKSGIMKSVLQRFNQLIENKANLLLRGESGVGKGTFLQKAIQQLEGTGLQVFKLRHHATKIQDLFQAPSGSVISVSDIDTLNQEQQEVLSKLLKSRQSNDLHTIWLATSVNNLESLAEAGKFEMELYYQLNFTNLLLPPLEHRREDMPEIISTYLAKSSHVLKIPLPAIPERIVDEIFERKLDENFNDLYRLLAEGLIHSAGQDTYQLPIQFHMAKGKSKEKAEVLQPYDRMMKAYLKEVMAATGGKVYGKDGAAAYLKLAPTTLQSKLKKYGIK